MSRFLKSYFGVIWSLIFSVCVLGDIVREDNYFEAEFSNIQKGRMLRVLMVFNNLRLDKCAVKCIQHIRCKTVNYNFEKLKCELTDVDFNENEADKLSYDWYNIGTHPRVDGGWGKWKNITQCKATCDGGTIIQARDCDSPTPQHGGHDCVGNGERTVECNTHPCPVNGNWGEWRNNTECNATCGGGVLNRTRTCDSPAPQHGGHDCVGNGERIVECNTHPCPVNGNWGEWRNDTECNATCGGGTLNRSRTCDSPAPQHGGHDCVGNGERIVECNTHPCPVNGNWGEWKDGTECNATCGGGFLNRTRTCDSPAPQHGGHDCVGNGERTVECNTHPCPVNGQWGNWKDVSACNASCGGGVLNQTRDCDSPRPANGGDDCTGPAEKTINCNEQNCPVNGQWGNWKNISACNVSCGGGVLNQTRDCDSPRPANGGDDCTGPAERTIKCNEQNCPVNGEWGSWTDVNSCSLTCDGGTKNQIRYCNSPEPQHGGEQCVGNGTRTIDCNTDPCPVNGVWGSWGGDTSCSATCDGGTKHQTRSCDSPTPKFGGEDCVGDISRTIGCNTNPCPLNGQWGSWGDDTPSCSATCDGGTVTQARYCDSPRPQHGGVPCFGDGTRTIDCNIHPCSGYLIQIAKCKREKGYCRDENGRDQNNGVTQINTANRSNEAAQNECLGLCLLHKDATGCEMIWNRKHWNRDNSGCYVHTKPIDRGSGSDDHYCWVFSKCQGAIILQKMIGIWRLSYSNGHNDTYSITGDGSVTLGSNKVTRRFEQSNYQAKFPFSQGWLLVRNLFRAAVWEYVRLGADGDLEVQQFCNDNCKDVLDGVVGQYCCSASGVREI